MTGIGLRELPSHQLAALSADYYRQAVILHQAAMACPTSLCQEYAIRVAAASELRELIHEINEILAERVNRHA